MKSGEAWHHLVVEIEMVGSETSPEDARNQDKRVLNNELVGLKEPHGRRFLACLRFLLIIFLFWR